MEFSLQKEYLHLFWHSYRLAVDSRGVIVWKRRRWWLYPRESFVLQALQDQVDALRESQSILERYGYRAIENLYALERQTYWSDSAKSILKRWRKELQERLARHEHLMNELESVAKEILKKATFISDNLDMEPPCLEAIQPLTAVTRRLSEERPATVNILQTQDDFLRKGHYLLKRLLVDEESYREPVVSYLFLLAGQNSVEAQGALKHLCESLGVLPSLETFLEYSARLGREHPQNHDKIVEALSKTLWFHVRLNDILKSIAAAFFANAELQDEAVVLPFLLGEEGEWNPCGQYKVLFKVPLGENQHKVYVKGVRVEDLFIRKVLEALEVEMNRQLAVFEPPVKPKPWKRTSLRKMKRMEYFSKKIEAFLAHYASAGAGAGAAIIRS